MIISNENSFPVVIDSVMIPLLTTHCWTMDLKNDDFFLKKISILTELKCSMFTLNINNYLINVPVDWFIMIYSPETSEIDLIQAHELTHGRFNAFAYNHKKTSIVSYPIKVLDIIQNTRFVYPFFAKHEMICHAVGQNHWIMLTNIDLYNRYIKNKLVGNFI